MVDNEFKLYTRSIERGTFELYHLVDDPKESRDASAKFPDVAKRLQATYLAWNKTVEASVAGHDYPEGKVNSQQPPRIFWTEVEAYRPFFKEWKKRPEDESRLKNR